MTHSMPSSPISGVPGTQGRLSLSELRIFLPFSSLSHVSSMFRPSFSAFSLSLRSQSHPRPLAISNNFAGVPTSTSTGRDFPPALTVNSPSPSPPSCCSAAICDARPPELGTFAREAHRTRNFSRCKSAFAKPASWRESSCVGASTRARGLTACCGGGLGACSVALRFWSIGRRYAMLFPEPVSLARRNSCHFPGVEWKRCLRESAWMDVGRASGPRMSLTDARRPGRRGGDVKFCGKIPDVSFGGRANSSPRGLWILGGRSVRSLCRGVPVDGWRRSASERGAFCQSLSFTLRRDDGSELLCKSEESCRRSSRAPSLLYPSRAGLRDDASDGLSRLRDGESRLRSSRSPLYLLDLESSRAEAGYLLGVALADPSKFLHGGAFGAQRSGRRSSRGATSYFPVFNREDAELARGSRSFTSRVREGASANVSSFPVD